ncbi:beta-lactamase family protein [Pseudenhygromyxa sp. WMMC2535]|uniref:serine hydrolase domain-containing protein n=1 Tax=Pseudenhygromyxa sp. WMMC2535 TaxID=2712867 RepID=UPI001555A41E|nr:serine hydrolase domain-containing protein [Pseudenhygromyxa sp. WMMC2535]NVB42655.1 beta-lactamase family protein [Pseudenhygromyxa sp. WMMC2535]
MRAASSKPPRVCALALAAVLSACATADPGAGAACPSEAPTPETLEVQVPVAPIEIAPPEAFDLEAIDTYLRAQVEDMGMVGFSVAIMRRGELVFASGYGQRSLEPAAPVEVDTEFAMASNTKQFTCAAALIMAEEGSLAMDDAVAEYMPGLTRADEVRILDLFQHTSGYPDLYPLDFVVSEMAAPTSTRALVERFGTMPLDFEPRTRWSYSNTGYLIAGLILEARAEQALADLMRARLFEPAGMTHTSLSELPPSATAARGYISFALGEPEPAVREGEGWLHAAGALWSTPSDLLRWDRALMDGELLSAESWAQMIAPAVLADGRSHGYGCGLGLREVEGEAVLSHSGAIDGFLSRNTMIPRTRSAVAVVTNSYFVDPTPIHDDLLALVIRAEQGEGRGAPQVAGPSATEAAVDLLRQMQAGEVDRGALSEEFSAFMTPARLEDAAPRLAALGEPVDVYLAGARERGGMEVSTVVFVFEAREGERVEIAARMFRAPDGTIHQFILRRSAP